jgi:hypothetical protein
MRGRRPVRTETQSEKRCVSEPTETCAEGAMEGTLGATTDGRWARGCAGFSEREGRAGREGRLERDVRLEQAGRSERKVRRAVSAEAARDRTLGARTRRFSEEGRGGERRKRAERLGRVVRGNGSDAMYVGRSPRRTASDRTLCAQTRRGGERGIRSACGAFGALASRPPCGFGAGPQLAVRSGPLIGRRLSRTATPAASCPPGLRADPCGSAA